MRVGSARLSTVDAINFAGSEPDAGTDWFLVWTFGGSAQVVADDVEAHFRSRAQAIDALFRTVADVPGNLDRPYWVRDGASIDSHLTVSTAAWTWADVVASVAGLAERPLDARVSAWHLHVHCRVVDARDTAVVVLQVSHALLAGPSTAALTQALFGQSAPPLHVPGLDHTRSRPRPIVSAAVGVARFPAAVVRSQILARKAAKLAQPTTSTPADRIASVLNVAPGAERCVRVLRPDIAAFRRAPETITVLATTALSIALERYLTEVGADCPPRLATLLTVAVDDDSLGVNRVVAASVDLHTDVPDWGERVRAIAADSTRARTEITAPATLTALAAQARAPFLFMLNGFRAMQRNIAADPVTTAAGSVTLTSVNAGSADGCELAGRALRSVALLASVPPTGGIVHSIVGCGDALTVSFITSPAVVPDPDRYADILETAFTELAQHLQRADDA